MTRDSPAPPDHLVWVIERRAKNQKAALDLYELIKHYGPQIRKKKLSTDAQDLAAVAFSLWRAVFLADRTGKAEAKMADVEFFLGKMLTDNAIAFTQDRGAREWTFNYYIDNALFRLEKLHKYWPDLRKIPLRPKPGKRTPRRRWDCLQQAFEEALRLFKRELLKKNSN